MKRTSLAGALAISVAVVLLAGSAQAAAPTKAQALCRKTIAKVATKYQATLVKSVALCNKLRNLNKAPYNGINCNDAAAAADVKGKLALTKSKGEGLVVKLCETVPGLKGTTAEVNELLALFPRCPSPASTADDGGLTTGIDNFTEVAQCQEALAEEYVSRMAAEAFGAPAIPMTIKGPIYNCSFAMFKGLYKAMLGYSKTRTKCQLLADKLGTSDLAVNYGYSCGNDDSKGLIARFNDSLNTFIDAGCNQPKEVLAPMGACGQTAAQLKECVTNRMVKRLGGGLVASAYALPSPTDVHPGAADVIINAAYGDKLTNTELDSGYTGFGHNVDLEDGYLGGVLIGACDEDGKNCPVTLDPSPAGKKYAGYSTCRCDQTAPVADPTTVACDVINGNDAVHCGGGLCDCMFGPPLPLSAGNAPVCVVNRFQNDFTGGTQEVGEYEVATRTAAVVHLGIGLTQPCPTCDGDATANDGTRGGLCNGGLRNGLACDQNGNSPDFGPISFDCLPSPVGNVGALQIGLTFTDGTQSITANGALPCAAGSCHCAECSAVPPELGIVVGCNSDSDCDDAATAAGKPTFGTCSATPQGAGKQNSCSGLTCDDDGTGSDQGVCGVATAAHSFCDGVSRGNGEGYVSCDANGQLDCDNSDCGGGPGSCGTCGGGAGGVALAKCFLPTLTATGVSGIFSSEGVSTFCSAATSNAGINSAGGLPGPGRVRLAYDFNLYCQDHVTPYDLPSGLNCP